MAVLIEFASHLKDFVTFSAGTFFNPMMSFAKIRVIEQSFN
jgi:hypothetical protein